MKIVSESPHYIPLSKLQDGQIAIILKWQGHFVCAPGVEHIVVQRYGQDLIKLGRPSEEGWSGVFNVDDTSPLERKKIDENNIVRILSEGSMLSI